MSILAKMLKGDEYPKFDDAVLANGAPTKVVKSMILSPNHVDLDSPSYLENKIKKEVRAFETLGVSTQPDTGEPVITVVMAIPGKHNKVDDIMALSKMGHAIANVAEDRLSEVHVLRSIDDDCNPWFDDEEKTC